mmetsp:Transcript_122241/g.353441  ORF Transcript_122241/g.353441 Transcript_122241/m.353441 type:complete len:529 (+) Transcript_122241:98-1684(+)
MKLLSTVTLLLSSVFHAPVESFVQKPALVQPTPSFSRRYVAAVEQDTAVDVVMETLEKRLGKSGKEPTLLSKEEINTAIQATDELIQQLWDRAEELEEEIPIEEEIKPKAAAPKSSPIQQPASQPVSNRPKPVRPDNFEELQAELQAAVGLMDTMKVSELLEQGAEIDEALADAAFWLVVEAVDKAEEEDQPLSPDIPRMLHHIFDADMNHLLGREKISKNVTCMQPAAESETEKARSMNYIFDDLAIRHLPLSEGRRCEGGTCCDACSRNIFPTFASDAETNLDTFPEIKSLTFNDLKSVSSKSILQFARLIERVRRTIAFEYGLPLKTILPLQAYSRKYVAGTTQQGGGGGEGDFVTLHCDEATHTGYHYSCVLYLSNQGEDFEGGNFVFNDPLPEGEKDENDGYDRSSMSLEDQIRLAGRRLTPFHPSRGAAVIFSSGWENLHEVEQITSGIRYCVPCFFTTCPVPDMAYEQMVAGKPKSDEDIADDWLHLLLAHREQETPQEAVGRVKELLMKWHYMHTPLSQH